MGDNAISREKRSLPPADYSLKIESFKLLSESTVESFESGVFKSGGYNWYAHLCMPASSLCIAYRIENECIILHLLINIYKFNLLIIFNNGGKDHLSLYLKIDDSNPHSDGTWNVNVYYKLFVYDQLSNQYLVVQDAKAPMRGFDRRKGEWGFGKFLDLATFNEPSNGYLVDESCVFGAEVYVVKPTGSEEILSFVSEPDDGTYRFTIPAFGSVGDTVQRSGEFTVGERNWQLVVYPAGSGADRGNYLTVSLKLADYQKVTPKKPVYAEFKFKIPNQYSRNRAGAEQKGEYPPFTGINSLLASYYFFNSAAEKESSKFLSRDDLYDTTKGYLPSNETLVVEVQFLVVSVIKANT
ncbi:TRAF-like family protein [Citrus sinensis]|nr:TRAF-like family protein [Citrus sinensis]